MRGKGWCRVARADDQQVWIPAEPEPRYVLGGLRCSCGHKFTTWWRGGRAAAREAYAQHWHRTHAAAAMFGRGPHTNQLVTLERAHELGYMQATSGALLPRCCRSAR